MTSHEILAANLPVFHVFNSLINLLMELKESKENKQNNSKDYKIPIISYLFGSFQTKTKFRKHK